MPQAPSCPVRTALDRGRVHAGRLRVFCVAESHDRAVLDQVAIFGLKLIESIPQLVAPALGFEQLTRAGPFVDGGLRWDFRRYEAGASALRSQPHQGFVDDDAVKPGRDAGFAAVAVAVSQHLLERELEDVLGGLGIARDPKGHRRESRLETREHLTQTFSVRIGEIVFRIDRV